MHLKRRAATIEALGLHGAALYWRRQNCRNGTFALRSKHADHRLLCRSGTSDIDAFRQIFVDREYAFLDDVRTTGLIVDCGANVGYSSAYLLSRFPKADLIAVEPEPGNYQLLSENLRPYGQRARALHTGVWSHPATLTVADDVVFRDGREWATQVRQVEPGETGMPAVDISTLLRSSGQNRISILKMDIEGAEAIVFGDAGAWLDLVDRIVVELHDDSAFGSGTTAFTEAIAGRGFSVERHGELTMATCTDAC